MKSAEISSHQPVFETDAVSIEYLTQAPEGITVETRQTLGRRALVEAVGEPSLTAEQAAAYRDALHDEANFQGVNNYKAALREHGYAGAQDSWRAYREKATKGQKVGIRFPEFNPDTNTLTVDVTGIAFPTYKELSRPDNNAEVRAFSEATGNAMVVMTADNRLVVQHRAIEKPHFLSDGKVRGNALYADIPGASVAGMFDAIPSETPGTPQAIDNRSIAASIMKEAGEELGLGNEHLSDVRIVGVAKDKLQPHDEFLFLAQTDLTSSELNETSRRSNRNKNLGDADFEEKFLTIEASPHAVQILLTDVRCPLPPTHAAAMVAAGYSMVLEQHGLDAANSWRAQLQTEMNENVQTINKTVANYYNRFAEAKTQVPERFWGKRAPERNLDGYSPAYGPEEQGLPSLEDELVRTGLKAETRQPINRAHLFDVDGVLSDPHEKRVIHQELLDQIINRLQNNEPVALNSGRSAEWVFKTVVAPVTERLGDNKQLLERLSIVGEKGGSWMTFNKKGEAHQGHTSALTLPDELITQVNDLISNDEEFNSLMTMQFDPHKRTMISPEMSATPEGVDPAVHLEQFHKAQERFAAEAQKLLKEAKLTDIFKIDKTAIATDIESRYVGKDLGADRFLEILKAQDVAFRAGESADFVTYGDSPSDMAMAEELERRGLEAEFVYVGKGEVTKRPGYTFNIHRPKAQYTAGVLEYLQTNT